MKKHLLKGFIFHFAKFRRKRNCLVSSSFLVEGEVWVTDDGEAGMTMTGIPKS